MFNNQKYIVMTHELPKLLYQDSELEPYISKETVEFHYRKHTQSYLDNVNRLIKDTIYENTQLEDIIQHASGVIFNNASQYWNHLFYFLAFSPSATETQPSVKLLDAINNSFGSLDEFKIKFVESGSTLFGSGWVWLCKDKDGKLQIVQTSNAGNPMTDNLIPLLCFDVWEHAYYIDYRNRRPDYLNALWNLVDWDVISKRFE